MSNLHVGHVFLCVPQVLTRMRPMVGTRLSVVYEPNEAHCALADDQRLYQAVHVVLANAFKYTRRVGGSWTGKRGSAGVAHMVPGLCLAALAYV
jgi:hypothetical protein